MKVVPTKIEGLVALEPTVFEDARGYFMESYKKEWFDANVAPTHFIQDNESKSTRGVLRGLHFQEGDYAQAKLVRVLQGEVLDVAVDLRPNSPTFGQHESIILSEANKKQFFIPRGFAHGFVVTSDSADFLYKTTDYWHPEFERSLLWNDTNLGIEWPLQGLPQLAAKDVAGLPLERAEVFA